MFKKYCETRSDDFLVSFGTFFAFKPFYVRSATDNDLEYCFCKTHLHACWAIQALIDCAHRDNIDIPVND